MIRKLIAVNKRLCSIIGSRLPQNRSNIFMKYEELVAFHLGDDDTLVVDVGGGRGCPYAKYRSPGKNPRIVAVDISDEELKQNSDVDEIKIADVVLGMPLPDESVDMVTSRCVLEHLPRVQPFLRHSWRILKPGGLSIHLVPCKFAPFAVLNQVIPRKLAKWLLYFFHEESKGIGGFPAVYDSCYLPVFERLFEQNGFEILETQVSYSQSKYYNFFLPLFVLSALYELIIGALGIRTLCAFILIVARKIASVPGQV